MKDDTSTPIPEGESPNSFERGKPDTADRSRAEAAIEELRQRGGVFVNAVRATRMPMVLTDPNLPGNPIVFANEAFLRLSGYAMDEVLGQEPHFLNGPKTDPKDAARFMEAIRADQDDIIETVQYRKNGSRFIATVLISAFKDDSGHSENHFMSWLDVTRRVDAEEELAELQATGDLLKAVFEAVPAGLSVVDRSGKLLMSNPVMRRFLPTGIIPSRDPESVHRWEADNPDGSPVSPEDFPTARALRGETTVPGLKMRYLDDDGRKIWTVVAATPIRDGEGEVGGAVCIVHDVTESKLAEEKVQASERRALVLLAELQHRVRSTLAVVRSIARRTAENSSSAMDMLAHFQGRLDAFSRVQAVITRSADATVDLASLIEDEMVAHAARDGEQVHVNGPAVALQPKEAERLSLAIHELTTNAVKHGALASRKGHVSIDWVRQQAGDGERLLLRWNESGVSTEGKSISKEGFGWSCCSGRFPMTSTARAR